jgi:hypothetical protein
MYTEREQEWRNIAYDRSEMLYRAEEKIIKYRSSLKQIAQVEREESDIHIALDKIRKIVEDALKEVPDEQAS